MPKKRRITNKRSIAAISGRAQSFLPPQRHEVGADKCLVVDGMSMAYTAYYAHNLSYKGKSTSIMYGMISQLKSIMAIYPPSKIVVCWDGNKSERRLKWLPEYKSHRAKNMTQKERNRFHKEVARVRKMLYYLGIPQCHNKEIEGDDMVYLVMKRMLNLYKVWIISGDKDFCQLINYDVTVYNPRTKIPYSTFAFICDNKVEIWQYVDFLCMVGDKSDDIPGYRGIGEVRASKLLLQYGSVKNFIKTKGAEFSGVSDKKHLKHICKRNRRLIDLKWYGEKYHSEKDILYYKGKRVPKFQEEKFKAYCRKYGLKTFLFTTFIEPFQKLYQNG